MPTPIPTPVPTVARLHELFSYCPETGTLTRKISTSPKTLAGTVAGYINEGYVNVVVDKRTMRAHRVAWALYYGKYPDDYVDHIDGNRANNRIANLRDVSKAENCQNQRTAQYGNPTGLLGVHPRPGYKFQAVISVGGKNKYLGTYATAGEAHEAYLQAKRQLHSSCTI
jgi:hypothetical protein